jgi:bacterioferritin (cytochrome b1)
MGFDFDRSEVDTGSQSESTLDLIDQALEDSLSAEHAAIDSYRKIAASAKLGDGAALRLVRVVLAVEEEHAQILATMRDSLRHLRPRET